MDGLLFNSLFKNAKRKKKQSNSLSHSKRKKLWSLIIWFKCLKVARDSLLHSDAFHDDLPEVRNIVLFQQRHAQFLLTEIYKSTATLNPQCPTKNIAMSHIIKDGIHYLSFNCKFNNLWYKLCAFPWIFNLEQITQFS